jgi:flagellar biosynthetic protein FlhB
MADESTGEKTEEATPKRLREARKKGNVPKSIDFSTAFLFLISFILLFCLASYIYQKLKELANECFLGAFTWQFDSATIEQLFKSCFSTIISVILPFICIIFLVSALINFFQVGPVLALEPIKPQLKKLNPISGFKQRFFTSRTYIELIKSVFKIMIVGLLAFLIIKSTLREILLSIHSHPTTAPTIIGIILKKIIINVGIFFVIVAVGDLFYQRYKYKKDLRMSKYEVKREFKEEEGDPLYRSHRQQIHQEIIMYDMVQGVKEADVIITNPTEIAVALRYDEKRMNAPCVIAKGQRKIAEKIVELAKYYKIPIVRNIDLAKKLVELDIGEEIPEELYEVVAEILNFVYQLKEKSTQD